MPNEGKHQVPPTVDILENPDFSPKFWGEMTLSHIFSPQEHVNDCIKWKEHQKNIEDSLTLQLNKEREKCAQLQKCIDSYSTATQQQQQQQQGNNSAFAGGGKQFQKIMIAASSLILDPGSLNIMIMI